MENFPIFHLIWPRCSHFFVIIIRGEIETQINWKNLSAIDSNNFKNVRRVVHGLYTILCETLYKRLISWFVFFRMSVRFIVSERSGCGKGLMVRRLSQPLESFLNNDIVTRQLKALGRDSPLCITVPIHGKMVDKSAVVEALNPHAVLPNIPLSRIYHQDIYPSVGIPIPHQNYRRISCSGVTQSLKG